MKISSKGLDIIKVSESCKLTAYRCAANKITIGWGSTKNVKMGMCITQEQADKRLLEDINVAEKAVSSLVRVKLTQNQFDALTSFVFNIGNGNFSNSTLLKKLNAGNYKAASEEFKRWNKADGKVLSGLTTRRKKETELFLS